MQTFQGVSGETRRWQGGRRTDFAELRRRLAQPSRLDPGHRQRLLELTQRLARVRDLGGSDFDRVECSGYVQAVMDPMAAAV